MSVPSVDAVFIGPQSSGKSVFMTYVQLMDQLASRYETELHEKESWSLKGALGERIERPVLVNQLDIGLMGKHGGGAIQPPSLGPNGSIPRPDPTKHALIYKTGLGDSKRFMLGDRLDFSFADLPGEWAPLRKERLKTGATHGPVSPDPDSVVGGLEPHHARLVHGMLARSKVIVLFVPFWSLLPQHHLFKMLGSGRFDRQLWSTSIPVATGARHHGEDLPPIDTHASQDAVEQAGTDLECWLNEALDKVRGKHHWVVVLSQFQPSVASAMLSSFSSNLGSKWMSAYEMLFERIRKEVPYRAYNLPWLSQQTADLDRLTRGLIHDIVGRARAEHTQDDLIALRQLGRLDERIREEATGTSRGLGLSSRVKSLSILPLNTIRDDGLGHWRPDLRMCHDVLMWIILLTRAHRIWAP